MIHPYLENREESIPKLLILRGLPSSGKTTYAKKWVSEDFLNRVRVNRDDIRRMLGPYWVPSREKLVTDIEWNSVISSLYRNYNVILDATNFRLTNVLAVKNKILEYSNEKLSLDIRFKDIYVPVEECIERDRNRENPVGEEVIMRMYNKYVKNEDNL